VRKVIFFEKRVFLDEILGTEGTRRSLLPRDLLTSEAGVLNN
jgi:hypothetical protein